MMASKKKKKTKAPIKKAAKKPARASSPKQRTTSAHKRDSARATSRATQAFDAARMNAPKDDNKPQARPYRDLAASLDGDHVAVFIPSLAALLTRAQEVKGAPLDDYEIRRVRDEAQCTITKREYADIARAVRGYDDVDPADVVASWNRLLSVS